MRAHCLLVLCASLTCARRSREPEQTTPTPQPSVTPAPVVETRWFALTTTAGARLGWSREALRIEGAEVDYERDDWIAVRRGPAPALVIATETRASGDRGAARSVTVRRSAGRVERILEAERGAAGWTLIAHDGAGVRSVTRVPAEAVPLPWLTVLARLGTPPASAIVVLTDRDGARVATRITPAPGALAITMQTPFGALEQRWDLDARRRITSVTTSGGRATLTTREQAMAAFVPIDVLADSPALTSTSASTSTSTSTRDTAPATFTSPPTPSDLAPTLLQPSTAAIRALVSPYATPATLALLTHDLLTSKTTAAPPLTATEALALRAGDCHAHANLLGALLRAARIPTRLVTGWILADDGWRLHRWNLAWIQGRWTALDATGSDGGDPSAPADRATHRAIAVHGATPEELLIDDLL